MKKATPDEIIASLGTRFEFGDALLFCYFVVFVRQCFWAFTNNFAGWALAVLVGAVVTGLYIRTKPFPTEHPHRQFWIIVATPLFLIYLLRLPFPDPSWDVLNYHLLHAERTLRGPLFIPGDFFPTAAPYNPAPDTLMGLFRLALGYRLGTIFNLFALIWTAQVTDKLLRPFVNINWLRAACVLAALFAEHLLFEVNTYMVDLLAVPLLLEATYLTVKADDANNTTMLFLHVALLLGLSTALKLTYLPCVAPIAFVCAFKALAGKNRLTGKRLFATALFTLIVFLLPLLPFTIYLERLTGNPIFPLGNKFFKSPFWETTGGWDSRWGPTHRWETIAWPVLSVFNPERHSELNVYSGRMAFGFLAGLFALIFLRKDARLRWFCVILLSGCWLWSIGGMGYSRYGLYLEVISGIVVIIVIASLRERSSNISLVLASVVFLGLVIQGGFALRYVLTYEWGMRPTALSDWHSYVYESRYIFRDRSLRDFLRASDKPRFAYVPAWIESGSKSTGPEVLLSPTTPVISVNHEQYFLSREAKQKFVDAISRTSSNNLYSLCFPEELTSCEEVIRRHGLEIGSVTPVELPFFSARRTMGMIFIEIPPANVQTLARWLETPFAEQDYRGHIEALKPVPAELHAGEKITLRFRVSNSGNQVWPAHGDAKGWYQVNLADRWLDVAERNLNSLDGRASLLADLPPGERAELYLTITAPQESGEYLLEIDLVHEGVTWFKDKGSQVLQTRVRVR